MQRKTTALRRQDAGENEAVEKVTERREFRGRDVSGVERRRRPTPLKKVSGRREFRGKQDVSEVERVSKRREFREREDVGAVSALKKVSEGREFRGGEDVGGVERGWRATPLKKVSRGREFRGKKAVSGLERVSEGREFRQGEHKRAQLLWSWPGTMALQRSTAVLLLVFGLAVVWQFGGGGPGAGLEGAWAASQKPPRPGSLNACAFWPRGEPSLPGGWSPWAGGQAGPKTRKAMHQGQTSTWLFVFSLFSS